MNIIEVKNNLVKLSYDENITLASFIKITDLKNSYIAQISHLESSRIGKIAIARLLFNFKNGIQAYDGSIPSIQAEVETLSNDFFVNCLDKNDPLLIGKITPDTEVMVSANLLKDKPIICAEKSYQYKQLIENIIKQNELEERKTVVFDITGEIQGSKVTATKDFKLPLNKDSIDYIFDRGFDDLTQENKAFIQDIFSELNDYIKTVEYIPFNDFNSVIEYEFKRTQKLQLIILKNRLTQFEKKGIFAQDSQEFKILENKFKQNNSLIIDLSKLDDSMQTEYIEYVYSEMEKLNTNFYSVLILNNNNSSATLLNKAFGTKNIFTSIVCPYSYKYLKELKQCSKNMFMFTPIKQQSDFGAYNIFLNKLAEDEFILYGKSTKFTPMIIKNIEVGVNNIVEPDIPEIEIVEEAGVNEGVNEGVELNVPEIELDEGTGVNEVVETEPTSAVNVSVKPETPGVNEKVELNVPEIEIIEGVGVNKVVETETPEIEIIEDIAVNDEVVSPETETKTETDVNEAVNTSVEPKLETTELEAPAKEESEINFANAFSDVSIDIDNDDLKNAISDRNEINNLLSQIQQSDPNAKPLDSEIPLQTVETPSEPNDEDDSELTDEDLDMIESLDAQITEEVGDSNLPEKVTAGVNDRVEAKPTQRINETVEIETPDVNNLVKTEQEVETESRPEPEEIETKVAESEPQEKKRQSITDEILEEEARRKAEEEAAKPDPIEEQIEKPVNKAETLETKAGSTPIVPVYSAEIPDEDIVESDNLEQGDQIIHAEFGRGIVEKIINYGERKLCSVNFEQVGRRLLDPKVSEMKKV